MDLAEIAESIHLIHRRNEYRGAAASAEKVRALAAEGKVHEVQGIITQARSDNGRFIGFDLMDLERNKFSIDGDEVLVFWGLAPDLGPIAEWGLELEKKQIPVDTEKFQTSVDGVFAIGDVNTYPGKKKFILSGFHEAALAAFGVQKYVYPEARQFVQYTTTSPIMHKRLGVAEDS
jgi:thioredoxin reductase (NADPH)